MKKFICLLTLLLFLLTGCNSKPERTKDIVVLFTGDVHCAVEENIGYASLKAYKDKLIEEGKEVILIDTGDAIQGGMIGSYSKGRSIIEIMNELGYNAMTVGNHEFDYSVENLIELKDYAQFPFLSCDFYELSKHYAFNKQQRKYKLCLISYQNNSTSLTYQKPQPQNCGFLLHN